MLDPLAAIQVDPAIAALPKADLHVHAESYPRLDRVLARREGRSAHDWHAAVARLMAEQPPGMARLAWMNGDLNTAPLEALDAEPEWFIARLADVLLEAAAGGAVLAEVRFGRETVYVPDFMARVQEAERRVRQAHPTFRAAATLCVRFSSIAEPEGMARLLAACRKAAREGMSGVDLLPEPYDIEADWRAAYVCAAWAVDAGLGITAHAGEFAAANIAAALHTPGLTRLGHAVHAAGDPALLEQIAVRGVTVECCLSSNVVLGAVPSYAAHPLRTFLAAGIPVTLNTDDPMRLATTIGREYAVGAALGLSHAELLACTRTAIQASFLATSIRQHLLASLERTASGERIGR